MVQHKKQQIKTDFINILNSSPSEFNFTIVDSFAIIIRYPINLLLCVNNLCPHCSFIAVKREPELFHEHCLFVSEVF